MPAQPIDRGLAAPGLLAHVLASKYLDHLPLHRQEQIYARDGVALPRSTMAGWLGQLEVLLEPLVERLAKHVLGATVIQADETPVPVLQPGNGRTATGYLWAYRSGPWQPTQAVVFDFAMSRGREAISIASARGHTLTQAEANAWAWNEGVVRLRRAIAERGNYALETTLGGDTIVDLLMEAADAGLEVNVWFVGLDSVELHVARVRQRVARGGHDIPRADIERRYIRARMNLIRLLPKLSQLVVYDNSAQADPDAPAKVAPRLLLRSVGGAIIGPSDLSQTPAWAKPIVAAALKLDRSRRRALGEPD